MRQHNAHASPRLNAPTGTNTRRQKHATNDALEPPRVNVPTKRANPQSETWSTQSESSLFQPVREDPHNGEVNAQKCNAGKRVAARSPGHRAATAEYTAFLGIIAYSSLSSLQTGCERICFSSNEVCRKDACTLHWPGAGGALLPLPPSTPLQAGLPRDHQPLPRH